MYPVSISHAKCKIMVKNQKVRRFFLKSKTSFRFKISIQQNRVFFFLFLSKQATRRYKAEGTNKKKRDPRLLKVGLNTLK